MKNIVGLNNNVSGFFFIKNENIVGMLQWMKRTARTTYFAPSLPMRTAVVFTPADLSKSKSSISFLNSKEMLYKKIIYISGSLSTDNGSMYENRKW